MGSWWLGIFVSAVIVVIAIIGGTDGCDGDLEARIECASDEVGGFFGRDPESWSVVFELLREALEEGVEP